ncbi:Dipeptide-binding protein DppE precursor [Roseovarius albus]|uniref:Dipeptide-binding protein DppE n=1 Tax=Roseovarius albus TaxID=1247867 RepID=A0A1X6Y6M0_9RHOB|nr:ABC transporter substrate-binding protein [Roseovarius albus]SLN12433.1 Dipeptide-binding protein DppE precursor [Roseovarius albus]
MDALKGLSKQLKENRVSRRSFMQQGLAAGVSVTALSVAADKVYASTPKKGGHLKVAKGHGSTTDALDPGIIENGYTIGLSLGGYQGYLTQIGGDGSLEPSLAESWDASSDAKTWTFKLRDGLEFHNGRTVKASDVIASINHHRGEGSTSAAAPLVASVKDLKADGDNIIVVELDAGNADFPFIMTDYHLPVMPANEDGSMNWQDLVGCGAYKIDNYQAGVSTLLSRHANHWSDDVGHVDTVELLSIIDQNARTSAIVAGDVHAIDRVDLKTADLMGRKPGVNLVTATGTLHYSLPMLTDTAPFDDNNVRLAVKYAVNRQEIVDKILFGYGEVGNDHPIGSGQRYFNKDLPQREYDPDKAKYYLKQSGLDSLAIAINASEAAFAGAVDAAILIQSSAKGAGIDLEVKRTPNDGFWAEHWIKSPFITSYWSGRPVEDQMFSTAYQTGVSWNETRQSHERFDKLLVDARAELDDELRRGMYYEMQEIVHNEGGALIPMYASYVFAVADNVGMSDTIATNWDMDGERWMERWWLN